MKGNSSDEDCTGNSNVQSDNTFQPLSLKTTPETPTHTILVAENRKSQGSENTNVIPNPLFLVLSNALRNPRNIPNLLKPH